MMCNVCNSIRILLLSFTMISTLHHLPCCEGLVSTKHRAPRGLTLFGTRWCGFGDSARHSGDLGKSNVMSKWTFQGNVFLIGYYALMEASFSYMKYKYLLSCVYWITQTLFTLYRIAFVPL